jgi:dimethylargininase
MMKHAIVRPPSSTFSKCISSHPLHHELNLSLALEQHRQYCKSLEDFGLDLIELSADELHPDSCFVEDVAIIHGERAVIGRMAKESRRGEDFTIQEILRDYKHLNRVQSPGTIEGGDVIHFDSLLISGITQRTNQEGLSQTSKWLGVKIDTIKDNSVVHLKSHMTALDRNTIVVTKRFFQHPIIRGFRKIIIPEDEEYAANTLTIDDTTLMSSSHPKSAKMVHDAGFEVLKLNMSEFEKCEGAITCLSIIF